MNFIDHSVIEGMGVLLSILIIIVLIRRGWKMHLVLILAVMLLALTNGQGLGPNLSLLYSSITSHTAYYLVTMVAAIIILGNLHQRIGAMEQMVNNLRQLIRDPRALLMIFPATISLFSTVPGGAVISAPMVEETGRELKMAPVELAMSNMVYRHLVVLITPFNSAIILASALTGISIGGFLSFTVPVIAIVFLIATVILLKRYPKISRVDQKPSPRDRSQAGIKLFVAASPYLAALTLGLGFGIFFPLALLIGIIICLLIKLPRSEKAAVLRHRALNLFNGFNWPMLIATLMIVIYKDFMLEADSFQQAVHYLADNGLPLILLVISLPFITGFIMGNTTASVGIAMPILIPLLGPDMLTVRYLGLAYLSSYAGYLGSPVHLCTYLTNEYFKTPLYDLVKQINIYGLILLLVGLALSLLY